MNYMVERTSRLEQYVCSADPPDCGPIDHEMASLSALESTARGERVTRELDLLSVLADPTRYRILRMLADTEELCVCELDAVLDVSDSAISHALRRLVDADLVTRRKEGRWRIYASTNRAERLLETVAAEASA